MDIVIEQLDEENKLAGAYHFKNAWLYKVEGPELNAKGNEVVVESIEISHEGLKFIKG